MKVCKTGGRLRGVMQQLTADQLAGAKRIFCAHCGGRVFSEDTGLTVYLTCSHCARTLAEVVKPKEALARGRLPARRSAA